MTHRTAIPSEPCGERGTALNNRISRSLSAQLFCGVLASLLAACLVFLASFLLEERILDHTVYGHPFAKEMADKQFEKLQQYVTDEGVTTENINRLNAWCNRGDKVYLTIYWNDTILYVSPISGKTTQNLNPAQYDLELENPDQEYALTLSDGPVVHAFLDYYAGDAFYFWATAIAGLLAFVTFSLCFITLVHKKISYIKRIKEDLDILAGGDLRYHVSIRGNDELSELASGIDQMRQSVLAHQIAEDEMRTANSQLVTAMSHDLRTPLTSLLAYLELLDRKKYDDPEQMSHFIQRSLEKALRIKSMADKLFEYFLVYDAEWEQPDFEDTDADALLQQFWGEYAFSLEAKGFTVEAHYEQLSGLLPVNLELIRRAFDNLYSNLLKYADPQSPIQIDIFREGNQGILTISNGISAHRDTCESTNIGLNTCRRIFQYHGGAFETTEDDGVFRAKAVMPLRAKPADG